MLDTYNENTYLALKKALYNKDIAGIEFDIRLTVDNKIVLSHDSLINMNSDGNGILETKTLSELKTYNFGTKIKQTITTLDKILDINSNKIFLIDIKPNHNEKVFAKVLYDYLLPYKDKNIYLASFNKKILRELKKIDNKLNIGGIYLFNFKLNNYDFYVLRHNYIKEKIILKIFKEKKDLFLWTINSNKDIDILKNKINNLDDIYLICDIDKLNL